MEHIEEKRLFDYLSDDLDYQARQAIEKHLKECAGCRQSLTEFESVLEETKLVFPAEPEEAFWINYLPRLRQRMETAPAYQGGYFHQIAAVFTGVLTILLIALMLTGGFKRNLIELNLEEWMAYSLYEPEYPDEGVDSLFQSTFEDIDVNDLECNPVNSYSVEEIYDEVSLEEFKQILDYVARGKII